MEEFKVNKIYIHDGEFMNPFNEPFKPIPIPNGHITGEIWNDGYFQFTSNKSKSAEILQKATYAEIKMSRPIDGKIPFSMVLYD